MADMSSERDNADRTKPPRPSVDGRLEEAGDDGVLGALPRTRPQRASPRRAAAQAKRGKAQQAAEPDVPKTASSPATPTRPKTAQPKGKPAKGQTRSKAASGRGTTSRRATPRPPARPAAPKQGYEPEEELELGRSVRPPGAAELVESVADIFLELASASLKSGGRALKEALSPLRRS
jgi:hypothetical protein